VVAAATGRVRFAGTVGGRGLVVVDHADGVITEYEPVLPSVHVGVAVARGTVIATVHGMHGACAIDRCLHWGARRDGSYFDPMTLLRALGPVRLLPWGEAVG
jgi:murein DD-endopeptidase MepM/ murein hydrolase activator NlpD